MKDQIVSLQVIYEDDIKLEIGNLETNQDVMVQWKNATDTLPENVKNATAQ